MRISIALATCNGARFLPEQLESLLLQSHAPYELIVSDDSSTDETLAIIANFSRRAPFAVKFCSNAGPLGFTENSLKAASACNGDAIAFCAQYDVWREDKLELCAAELAREDVCLVLHQFVATDNQLQDWGGCVPRTRSSMTLERLQPEPELAWLPGCAMVFRRPVLRELCTDGLLPMRSSHRNSAAASSLTMERCSSWRTEWGGSRTLPSPWCDIAATRL
jgi:glycosyltransferase involved in cell wall biosynthesis